MLTSEHLFHLIVETTSDAIVAIDSGGEIIFWNRAAGALFGYSAEEMKNKHLTDLIPERFRESHEEALGRALSTGQSDFAGKTIELSGCRQDGSEFPLELSLAPWKNGEEVFFTATIRDITEHRRAEEALRDSQQMLQTVLDSIPSAVFWKDRDSIYLGGNRIWLEGIGLKSSDEVVGKSDFDLPWEKKQADSFREYDRKIIDSGIPEYDIIEPYFRADGIHAWARTNKVPLHDTEGNVVGILGTYEDITERKRAEEALKESEEHYRELSDSITDVFFAFDKDLKYAYWNRASEKLTGISAEDAIGKSLFDLFPDTPQTRKAEKVYLDALRTQQSQTFVNEYQLGDKDYFFEISAYPSKEGISVFTKDITERKRTEVALRESEGKYRAIFEQAAESIVLVDAETGELIEFNDRTHENLGYTREEFKKLKIPDFEVMESEEEVAKHIEKIIKQGFDAFETKHRTKDGKIRDILVNSKAISIHGKNFIMTIWRDITERRQAEYALRESEEKYRTIFENVSDSITYVDKYGTIIRANDKEAIFGRKPEEIIGKKFTELGYFDVKDIPKYLKLFKNVITGKKTINLMELEIKHEDGHKIPVEVNISLVKKNGKIEGFLCVVRDITERKRAEEELRTSEEKYRLLSENAIDGIYILGPNGFEYVNPAFEQTSGYKAEEILREGFDWWELVHLDDKPLIVERIKRREKSEELSPTYEFRLIRKDGKVCFVEVNTVLLPGEPWRVLGIYRDVTERKRAEEALQDSEAKHRNILESIEEGYFEVDLAGNLTFFNDSLCRMVGFSRGELMGMNNREYTSPETAKKMYEAFNEMYRTGKSLQLTDYKVIRVDGNIQVLEMSASLMRDPSGEPIGFRGVVRDTTERKRAEEALRESEGKYRSLVESTDDAVYLISRGMHYEFANGKYLSRLGLSLTELVGQEYGELHPWDTKDEFEKKVDQVIKSGKPMTYEYLSQRDNKYFMRTLSPVIDEELGEIKAITVTSKDITELKQAEEELRDSKELFEKTFNSQLDAIFILNAEIPPKIREWNAAVVDMFGYENQEMSGRTTAFLHVDETMLKKFQELLYPAIEENGFFSLPEFKMKRKNGTVFPTEHSVVPIKDDQGKSVGWVSIVRDITERKHAEEALWSSQEYSQNIVDSSLDMIIAVDNKRRITAINTAAVETFGYESEELLGKHANLLYADPKEGLRVHKETVKHGHHIQEILNRRKNGELFPCLLSASVLCDADGNRVGVMGISRDITERKQAEDKLRHYASELERSNKELQQFAHAVSHDLQEPLRTIRSYLRLLADRYQQQLDADADTFIAHAVGGADRMRERIRGILAYSQVEIQAQEFEPKDYEEVLESTLANLQVTIKETQAQVTHDPLPTVMADGPQMGQLLQNLIKNAIKFRKEEPPCVHISAREERDHWLFSVRDNGIGIDPGQSELIFEIFQRLAPRNEYPGTGIGLSICRKIVERHGGSIWVESTPGKGSTFFFTIAK